jgi:hypothetical protein
MVIHSKLSHDSTASKICSWNSIVKSYIKKRTWCWDGRAFFCLHENTSFTNNIRAVSGCTVICWVTWGWDGGGGDGGVCARQRQSPGNPAIMMATRRASLTTGHNLTDPDLTNKRSIYKGNQIWPSISLLAALTLGWAKCYDYYNNETS